MKYKSAVVLRKVSGALTACFANRTLVSMSALRSMAARPSIASTAMVLAILLLPLIAVAALAGLFAPKMIVGLASAKLIAALPFVGQTETVSNAAVEAREKYKSRFKEMCEILELAGPEKDLSRREVLERLGAKDSTEAFEKLMSRDRELVGLHADVRKADLKRLSDDNERRERELNTPATAVSPSMLTPDGQVKSFGDLWIASKSYDAWVKNRLTMQPVTLDVGLKTLFQTSAGFAPESVRSGLVVPSAQAPLALIDLVPVRPISQAVDKYMQETTTTLNAAEKGEGVAYAESAFAYTEQTSTVRKITTSLPTTDEQLDDAPMVAAILNSRLVFDIRKRLNGQLAVGDGSSPNLAGFLDDSRTDVQTQARGSDPRFDAIFKAMIKVIYTGGAMPSGVVLNPTDWQSVRLARTADGQYIMGNPSQPGSQTIFGLPCAIENAITQGTSLVGDFLNFSYVAERKGIEVSIGYVNDDFTKGRKTLRAETRVAFTVPREAAFCTVTGM